MTRRFEKSKYEPSLARTFTAYPAEDSFLNLPKQFPVSPPLRLHSLQDPSIQKWERGARCIAISKFNYFSDTLPSCLHGLQNPSILYSEKEARGVSYLTDIE